MNENNKVILETEVFNLEKETNIDNMKSKPSRSNNDNKKKLIIYIALGGLLLIIIGFIIYMVINNKNDSLNEDKENEVVNKEDKGDNEDKKEDKIAYVSCDDNTSLLNVRNSTSGDIIDGLSCFKEVTIESELEGTDNCKKWYKISYSKRGSNYTGYACGTYINQSTSDSEIKKIKEVIDKANNYYENNVLKAFCGDNTGDIKNIEYKEGENSFTGYYVKSEYKTLSELNEYLLTFLDEDLISPKLKLSDINNKRMYDDYYEIDGNLYCRNYAGKGWNTRYTGNYNIEITFISSEKITGRIAYEYLIEGSKCDIKNLSKCTNSNFEYELSEFVVKTSDNGYIITNIDFHK